MIGLCQTRRITMSSKKSLYFIGRLVILIGFLIHSHNAFSKTATSLRDRDSFAKISELEYLDAKRQQVIAESKVNGLTSTVKKLRNENKSLYHSISILREENTTLKTALSNKRAQDPQTPLSEQLIVETGSMEVHRDTNEPSVQSEATQSHRQEEAPLEFSPSSRAIQEVTEALIAKDTLITQLQIIIERQASYIRSLEESTHRETSPSQNTDNTSPVPAVRPRPIAARPLLGEDQAPIGLPPLPRLIPAMIEPIDSLPYRTPTPQHREEAIEEPERIVVVRRETLLETGWQAFLSHFSEIYHFFQSQQRSHSESSLPLRRKLLTDFDEDRIALRSSSPLLSEDFDDFSIVPSSSERYFPISESELRRTLMVFSYFVQQLSVRPTHWEEASLAPSAVLFTPGRQNRRIPQNLTWDSSLSLRKILTPPPVRRRVAVMPPSHSLPLYFPLIRPPASDTLELLRATLASADRSLNRRSINKPKLTLAPRGLQVLPQPEEDPTLLIQKGRGDLPPSLVVSRTIVPRTLVSSTVSSSPFSVQQEADFEVMERRLRQQLVGEIMHLEDQISILTQRNLVLEQDASQSFHTHRWVTSDLRKELERLRPIEVVFQEQNAELLSKEERLRELQRINAQLRKQREILEASTKNLTEENDRINIGIRTIQAESQGKQRRIEALEKERNAIATERTLIEEDLESARTELVASQRLCRRLQQERMRIAEETEQTHAAEMKRAREEWETQRSDALEKMLAETKLLNSRISDFGGAVRNLEEQLKITNTEHSRRMVVVQEENHTLSRKLAETGAAHRMYINSMIWRFLGTLDWDEGDAESQRVVAYAEATSTREDIDAFIDQYVDTYRALSRSLRVRSRFVSDDEIAESHGR